MELLYSLQRNPEQYSGKCMLMIRKKRGLIQYYFLSRQWLANNHPDKAANINADSPKIMQLFRDVFINHNKVGPVTTAPTCRFN